MKNNALTSTKNFGLLLVFFGILAVSTFAEPGLTQDQQGTCVKAMRECLGDTVDTVSEKGADFAESAKTGLHYAQVGTKYGLLKLYRGSQYLYGTAGEKWKELSPTLREYMVVNRRVLDAAWYIGLAGLVIVFSAITYYSCPWVSRKVGRFKSYWRTKWANTKSNYYRWRAFLYNFRALIKGTFGRDNAFDRATAQLYEAKALAMIAEGQYEGGGIVDRAAETLHVARDMAADGLHIAKDKAAEGFSAASEKAGVVLADAKERFGPMGENLAHRAAETLTEAKHVVENAFSKHDQTFTERAKETLSNAAISVHDAIVGKKEPETLAGRAAATLSDAKTKVEDAVEDVIGMMKRKTE